MTVALTPQLLPSTPATHDALTQAEIARRLGVVERTAGRVGGGSLNGGNVLIAGSVTSAALYAGLVDADLIQAFHIAANAINAGHINVATLSAISADLGSITAGTITGATFRTSSAPARVQMDATGLWAHDGTVERFRLGADGSLTVTGGAITGATFQTATSGARVVIDGTGIVGRDAADVVRFRFDTTTGLAELNGKVVTGVGSSLDGSYVVDSTISAAKLNVGTLSAITADLGTVTAGTISGLTITGGTITGSVVRTAASGARVEMNTGGLVATNAAGATVVSLPTSGEPYFAGRILASGGIEQTAAAIYPAPSSSKHRWVDPTTGAERTALLGTVTNYPNTRGGHMGSTGVAGTQAAGGAARAQAQAGSSYRQVLLADANLIRYWRLNATPSPDEKGGPSLAYNDGQVTPVGGLIAGTDLALRFTPYESSEEASVSITGVGFAPTTGTVEAWIQPHTLGWTELLQFAVPFVQGFDSGGTRTFRIFAHSDGTWRGEARIGGADRTVTTSTPVAFNTTKRVELTYTGSALELWLDGTMIGTTATSGAWTATNLAWVGVQATSAPPLGPSATIDEVALYNAPLTVAERADHNQTGTTGVSTSTTVQEVLLIDSDGRSQIPLEWTWNLTNVTSFTIDATKIPGGLDGDNDYEYELIIVGRINSTTSARNIHLRPNNDSGGNYDSSMHRLGWLGGSIHDVQNAGGSGWRLGEIPNWNSANHTVVINALIAAKAYGSGVFRTCDTRCSMSKGTAGQTDRIKYDTAAWWNNGTSNITSLVIDFGGSTLSEGVVILRRKRLAA